MKIVSILCIILALGAGCKSDKSVEAGGDESMPMSQTSPSNLNTIEVRHAEKNDKDKMNSSPKQPTQADINTKHQQLEEYETLKKNSAPNVKKKEKKRGNKLVDPNFPSTMRLISVEEIEKAFEVEKRRVRNKSKKHDSDGGSSKSVWTWNTSNGETNTLNVIMARNPSPENYLDWSKVTLDRYIDAGLMVNDGSKLEFEEIIKNGHRFAWNPDLNMLKWFQGEVFSISLTGFGAEFNKERMLKMAASINGKIASFK